NAVILVVEVERGLALAEHRQFHRLFGRTERLAALARLELHVALLLLDQLVMALHRGVDQRGGEHLVVSTPLPDVAYGRSRHTVWWREQRHDRAGLRVAPDLAPGEDVVADHEQQRDTGRRKRRVVGEPELGLPRVARRSDDPLLPAGGD